MRITRGSPLGEVLKDNKKKRLRRIKRSTELMEDRNTNTWLAVYDGQYVKKNEDNFEI